MKPSGFNPADPQ